jgi:hypothetical protein
MDNEITTEVRGDAYLFDLAGNLAQCREYNSEKASYGTNVRRLLGLEC